MDRRQWWQENKRWILPLAVLVIAVAVFLWWFLAQRQPRDIVLTDQTAWSGTGVGSVSSGTEIRAPEGGAAVVAARNFAERFGSYSNQNPYDNIKQLFPLMTARLRATFPGAAAVTSDSYQGVESRVISIKVLQTSDVAARLTVTLQRSERDASLRVKVYYQDLALTLVKELNQWLVDSAQWSKL